MRKVLFSMCVALVGLCASAQEAGDMAVGLNLGVAPCLESGAKVTNFGIGAKFQYNVTTPIRLEADIDYWLKDKGADVFDVTLNCHYIFKVGDKINFYPLIGVGYAKLGVSADFEGEWDDDDYRSYSRSIDDDDDMSSSCNKLLFNAGIGAEYAISSNISVGLEIKYQYMKHFSRLPINLGVTYSF